jgi:hypothetical protein
VFGVGVVDGGGGGVCCAVFVGGGLVSSDPHDIINALEAMAVAENNASPVLMTLLL